MNNTAHLLFDYLVANGMETKSASYINMFALLIATLVLIFIIDYSIRKFLILSFNKIAIKSKTHFDDLLIVNKAPRNIAHIIPLLIAISLYPIVFYDFQYTKNIVEKGLEIFGIILVLWIIRSLLHTLKDYFKTLPRLKDKPIDSYIQVFMIIAWGIGLAAVFVVITNVSFIKFMTTIGAASAVILLIFKDTILGFVASIQVSINDMVRIGDWITFQKYGADGDVIEINLSTVKVQNFDKTITTIPTYALISDSFKNWRGMMNSDGRRIKRALIIKLNSVKYLSNDEIDNLSKIELITNYLKGRQQKIAAYNTENNIDKTILLNGRNLTNIGVFRKYIDTYLNQHSAINKDMMIMCRQLAPTSQGIPLEVYAFSADKEWANYEYIMADIFDHLIAATSYFDLELFELPNTGNFKVASEYQK